MRGSRPALLKVPAPLMLLEVLASLVLLKVLVAPALLKVCWPGTARDMGRRPDHLNCLGS